MSHLPSPLPSELAVRVDMAVSRLQDEMTAVRRELHAYPEEGFTEFRTAARVAAELWNLGYRVRVGAEVMVPQERLGMPPTEEIEATWRAAAESGAPMRWLEPMRGGLTGVVADLDTGRPGPTVAFRFDMDALPIVEALDPGHVPAAGGFASRRPASMHACGHDGHTAMGLALAALAREISFDLAGRLRLIFQPAEEGGRGGGSMVAAGVCEGIDYLLCVHLGLGVPSGEVVGGATEFLASTRFVATFRGAASHAGLTPEAGRSALLAAAQAILALHSLPQHSGGRTRVNAGVLHGGMAANIVAPEAVLEFETRSDRTEINDYLEQRAREVVKGAAATFGCTVELALNGRTAAGDSDPGLAALLVDEANRIPAVRQARLHHFFGASEDATLLMADVHRRGGRATYAILGADLAGPHHNERFDFDERSLPTGVRMLAGALFRLTLV